MKSHTPTFDRRLYDLLQRPEHVTFTIRQCKVAYAEQLAGDSYRLPDLRRYVYEQVRKLLRLGLVEREGEKRRQDQRYRVRDGLHKAEVQLIDHGFEKWKQRNNDFKESSANDLHADPKENSGSYTSTKEIFRVKRHLEQKLKVTRLDLLTAMGEAEFFKELISELPQEKDRIEPQYQEAKDRSSRLLGHLKAAEKTIEVLTGSCPDN